MSALPDFLAGTEWKGATLEPVTGDASARKYFRLRNKSETAILMDASRARETLLPFVQIAGHLRALGLSSPKILARDVNNGFLLLEDFGDETFSRLLDHGFDAEELFALGTDVLIALHQRPDAVPHDLRVYSPQKMLEDAELFLEVHEISEIGVDGFRRAWREVLPIAHQVPVSLLLRDYHVANLMMLSPSASSLSPQQGEGLRVRGEHDNASPVLSGTVPGTDVCRVGLLDFQDAYQGPITYDLVSLLEDARRDLPAGLKDKMVSRYLGRFSGLDAAQFKTSMAVLSALRHTRVLAVFERLGRQGKPDYKKLHSPRVERMLHEALRHPKLAALKDWFARYAK